MRPVKTPDSNMVYRGSTDAIGIGDLWCQRIQPGLIQSVWKPNEAELAVLNDGGFVELGIHNEPIPPVSVNVLPKMDVEPNPFRVEEESVKT